MPHVKVAGGRSRFLNSRGHVLKDILSRPAHPQNILLRYVIYSHPNMGKKMPKKEERSLKRLKTHGHQFRPFPAQKKPHQNK